MIYIIFLVTIAQKLFLKFLPPFKVINNEEDKNAKTGEDIRLYGDIFQKYFKKSAYSFAFINCSGCNFTGYCRSVTQSISNDGCHFGSNDNSNFVFAYPVCT